MASAALKEELTCSICLNIYRDPASLRCGHSFCLECIKNVLETPLTSQGATCRACPECRAEFQELPSLQKNVSLHNIATHFLSAQKEQEEAQIFCTYCIESHVPAVKSCLLCDASLCDDHLKVHSKSLEHILVEPVTPTGNRRCTTHEKTLLYYCSDDATCVCVSCILAGEHKGHQVEPINEASKIMKERLRKLLGHLTSKRQEANRSLQTLEDYKTEMPEKVLGIKGSITTLLRDIRRRLDFLEKKVFCELSNEEERETLSVLDLIERLEVKKEKLSMDIHHIKELCDMTDPLTLLQADRSSFAEMEMKEKEIVNEGTDILHFIKGLDEGLIAATLYKGLEDIVTGIKRTSYIPADPDILLDVNTAASSLNVSVDLRFASCLATWKDRPKTPERFQWHQVLSTKRFSTGKHFWEVEIGKTGIFRVGVAYATVERQGAPSYLGNNGKSWGLRRYQGEYSFYSDYEKVVILPHKPSCQRLAVYLDYEAGQLSFYELSDPIRHLHTTKTTFAEPVYPGFLINQDSWFRIQ